MKDIRELLEQSGFEVAVEQEERLRGTDRYNLYARQLTLGGLQRNGTKRAGHDGNGRQWSWASAGVVESSWRRRRRALPVAQSTASEIIRIATRLSSSTIKFLGSEYICVTG